MLVKQFTIRITGLLWLILLANCLQAQQVLLVVDKEGKGDFRSIQDAVNSLPDTANEQRVIYIKNGTYSEKVFISKHKITLTGEDKHKTILSISLSRDVWRCESADDWGVAAINLNGNDIVLENLSIINSYGFDNVNDTYVDCKTDTGTITKQVRRSSHQMALRSFATTRLIVRNCILRAYGGDTVSPWNVEEGMYYFKDCLMEGGVDFYCPRGWAWAENCEFVAHGNVAAIWHDGSKYEDSKTVLVNCTFRGDDGFKLGRYHRDAQFYLLNCSFAANMADAPVYLNPSNPQNTILWGKRVYFFNSHRKGGDYSWHKDNLHEAKGSPKAEMITPQWTFGGRWNPQAIVPFVFKQKDTRDKGISGRQDTRTVNDIVLQAENMLLYQRAVGGWPKAVGEVKVDYTKQLSEAEKKRTLADSLRKDATIDNSATTKEIRFLINAYKQTGDARYLKAAEKGIRYCLKAQYANGGWPQYYPDSSSYRAQITYNDNAMVNVLNVMQDIVEQKNNFNLVDASLIPPATEAVAKGISCILKTQLIVNGKLSAWCAQYNRKTLQPEMARKFELVSLSGMESAGIVSFLLRIPHPTQEMKQAIQAAVEWFETVKINGYVYKDIVDAAMPDGKDRVIVEQANAALWARFYEIPNNRPFFTGRDSIRKYKLTEIEHERRVGYAWYGTWPEKILVKDYPAWKKKNLIN
ncbi:pectate lyase [Sediminibacterium sp.]|uniref:pectate lyase n=1 Tax=Sediminibacterium sp. TaxID=1917865 RepID=UPI0025FA9D8C|nr:pectate lyase [Sediminibacterium sp.]MBW0177482.1 pectate lyase [Sediminibacterium sp.]